MKYIDFSVQTLILAGGAIFSLYSIHNNEWFLIILFTQLILGPWQLLSSLISVLTNSDLWKMKRLHIIVSLSYLLVLFIGLNGGLKFLRSPDFVSALFVTIPAMSLAIFYYILTCKCVVTIKKKRGSFLPNLSF